MDRKSPNHLIDPDRMLPNPGNDSQDPADMLGDERRIKVLSPGMMVLKRFLRNRLAITGLIILVFMFAFSFIGGLLSAYRQDQTFFTTESMLKEYAGATRNTELRYTVAQGEEFSKGAYARLILAINNDENSFEANGKKYEYTLLGDEFYRIRELKTVADVAARKRLFGYTPAPGVTLTAPIKAAFEQAYNAGEDSFEFDGTSYSIFRANNQVSIGEAFEVALASKNIFDAVKPEDISLINSYPFRLNAETAISEGDSRFTLDGVEYQIIPEEGGFVISRITGNETQPMALVSDFIINPILPDIFLDIGFKEAVAEAITEDKPAFTYNGVLYTITLVHKTFNIKTQTETQVFDMYRQPDGKHFLGTDQNGMDVLTRLMYGGRISLMVGFVVVFLEMIIGILVGGVSGYFGGWVDTLMMRFIDLFNCIPYWPIMIIAGSVMDTLSVDPYLRVFFLMFIMGLMGWTGIARVVRGQILALREQDFMIATEATGIRVSRRIGKHLVPNVMPLLIVQATMGLGSIILTEATLSFLGLGIKYPLASWGSIINAASNPYIVTNYWFIWVPAGLLILLTVLGFNFVGDGLRDAYDPKMKR